MRSLEREIGKLCRTKAVEYSASRDERDPKPYDSSISVEDVERILGIARFEQEVREETHRPGVVTCVTFSFGRSRLCREEAWHTRDPGREASCLLSRR